MNEYDAVVSDLGFCRLEVKELRQQLSSAKEEIERLKHPASECSCGNFKPMQNEIRSLRKDLAASQALVLKYREALEFYASPDTEADWGQEQGLTAQQAIATPSDSTALREFGLRVAEECKRVSCDMRIRRIDWDSVSLEYIVNEVLK